MAPTRRARSPGPSKPVYRDDTDNESDQETPRPQKGSLKKRLSEVYHPDNDNSETSRPPLRAVNINDDAAEKRRRRKSTKIHVIENSLPGPSSEGGLEQPPEPPRGAKQKPLQSVTPLEGQVRLEILSSNFEEWMKLATDNVRWIDLYPNASY